MCVAKRLPPPLPEDVHRLLRDEKVFTNRSDVDKVADLYRSFFEAVTADARELDLSGLGWGDGEAAALAAALPSFAAVTSLSVASNAIGAEGAQRLAQTEQVYHRRRRPWEVRRLPTHYLAQGPRCT